MGSLKPGNRIRIRIADTRSPGRDSEFVTASASLTLGRHLPPGPDHLNLDDGQVSARHARITAEEDGYWIEDLNSSNGTWLDERRLEEKSLLKENSIVRIGRIQLRLGFPPAPPFPASSPDDHASGQTPAEIVEAGSSLPDLYLADSSPESLRERLSVVGELSASLDEIESIESLASVLLDYLERAFPCFKRGGHGGLLLGSELILTSYRPEDGPPTCSLSLARYVQNQQKACLWRLGMAGDLAPSASLVGAGTQSAMYAPLVWKGECFGVVYLDAASVQAAFQKEDLRLIQIIATQTAMFIKNFSLQKTLQKEAILRSRLLAQFPRSIAERMAKLPEHASIPSERLEAVTVLMADVRGFTQLSAVMDPEDVVRMLNEMFHDLTPIVLKHNGTVDKYVGDGLLAVFGSPEPDDRQWENAVRAALEMQAAIKFLGEGRWRDRSPFRIGIGLHTGPAIHGFIGAPERLEYTVIGYTINLTSRYCAAAAPGEVLISPLVYSRVHQSFEVDHPPREIESKHEGRMKAYLVRGEKGPKDGPPS